MKQAFTKIQSILEDQNFAIVNQEKNLNFLEMIHKNKRLKAQVTRTIQDTLLLRLISFGRQQMKADLQYALNYFVEIEIDGEKFLPREPKIAKPKDDATKKIFEKIIKELKK